jgi:glycosyltransferase involved in cell wall biosynthesis
LGTPKKTREFADLIIKLVDDADTRAQMAVATRQKALAYSWETINNGLLAQYNEALSQPCPDLKF